MLTFKKKFLYIEQNGGLFSFKTISAFAGIEKGPNLKLSIAKTGYIQRKAEALR